MKLEGSSASRIVMAMLVVAALAAAFWILLLSPKRDEAKQLAAQVDEVKASLAQHRAEVAEAEDARREFPTQYQRLVVLGKAVPGDDDTASMFVQVNRTAENASISFDDLELEPSSGSTEAPSVPTSGPGERPVSATEAAASVLPLGASIGPAGLGVLPYSLTFKGNFFDIADFIKGLDSLVKSNNEKVTVDGRLITLDGFALEAEQDSGFPQLEAHFAMTTYLTPPSQGVTGGATPSAPGSESATPAATTTGATP